MTCWMEVRRREGEKERRTHGEYYEVDRIEGRRKEGTRLTRLFTNRCTNGNGKSVVRETMDGKCRPLTAHDTTRRPSPSRRGIDAGTPVAVVLSSLRDSSEPCSVSPPADEASSQQSRVTSLCSQ